ncbi:MAG: DUF4430 domain-containing protein [Gaiellaceae bacterium]
MRRTLFASLGLCALALSLVPAGLAARVHVRVEGKTQTIYGAAEPTVDVANPLAAIEAASLFGEFYYHVTTTAFGPYVDQVGRYPAGGTSGWVFKVNGDSPPVGADKVELKAGDRVLWYWATFGPTGAGPETLSLRRVNRRCYAVAAQDDTGKTRPAAGSVLRVDGRAVKTRAGQGCVGKHRGLVRATLAGAVRSNALP